MIQNLPLSQCFVIKPSQLHEKLLKVLHVLAILACAVSTMGAIFKMALIGSILVLRMTANRGRQSGIYQLRFTEFSGWEMAFEHNDYNRVTISESTVVTAFVIFLHCNMQNQTSKTLLIANDSLSKNDFRRLIVRLRISGHERHL